MKIEVGEALWVEPLLGEDQFEFMSRVEDEFRSRLRTDAKPVNARWSETRAIRFDGYLETCIVQSIYERLVELEKRLAARTDDEGTHAR